MSTPSRPAQAGLERAGTPAGGPSWLQVVKPAPWEVVAVVAVAVLFVWLSLADTMAGRLLAPLIGIPESGSPPGFLRDLVTGVMLAVALWLNFALLRFLPFPFQVGIFWIELLLLFAAFVNSFDRDLGVWFERGRSGETNLAFLITTGAVTTIYVSLASIAVACVLAMAAALGKLSRSGPGYAISTFYISFFRGTPLLLQVYLIYLGLPQLGPEFAISAVPSGILALSLCYGAYMAEIFRAGISGVPQGQREAAMALGLWHSIIFRKIVFPQAMRLIVPPTGNQFIAMLKDSSLVSVMGVWELTKSAQVIGRRDFTVLEMLIAAAIIYWIMSICFEMVQTRIEAYYGKGDRR